MRDFTDQVGPRFSRDRYPLAQMAEVGDHFTVADEPIASVRVAISVAAKQIPDRRFSTFSVGGGVRVMTIDVIGSQSAA